MTELRIIVTGGRSRNRREDYRTLEEDIRRLDAQRGDAACVTIIQGGCPDGIDAMARSLARDYGFRVETVPADFDLHPDDAVEVSNQEMADRGARICIAFPNESGQSLGTWDMAHRAIAAGIKTVIYPVCQHATVREGGTHE